MLKTRTLSDGLEQGGDNFLLLRFIAAAMVIYGHAPAITGGSGPLDLFVWLNWGEYSGSIAVDMFFVISGFMITGSFLRRQHVVDFAWARFIRIMPAYATCMIVCAFAIGAAFTILPLSDYFTLREPYEYVWKNLRLTTDMVWDLPGVFSGNPQRTTINGAIWTLPAEVRMYTWVAFLGLIGVVSRRWLFNIAIVGLFVFGMLHPASIPLVPINDYVKLAALFATGAFCYVNRSWIPVHGGLLLAACGVAFVCRSTHVYPYLFGGCEALFVFWFAYNMRWHWFNRFGDYSYGIYLWGFPSQQMVAAFYPSFPFLLNALCGFVVALLLAIASWRFIEKPALRLKGAPSAFMRRLRNKAEPAPG
ncbi:MAG: acyltransferase [Lysobacteraceae bacterium]